MPGRRPTWPSNLLNLMADPSQPSILVVGSANLDIVVPVPHHPAKGETVLGGNHEQIPGGKGANQAVASARLGGKVAFLGMVGSDPAGRTLRSSLDDAGVDTRALGTSPDVPSGIALITVGPDGDNAIVVSPGANEQVVPSMLDEHAALLDASVVQLQLEIPLETIIACAQRANGIVILDPAPAPASGLPQDLLDAVDILIPNETELALLARRSVDADDIDDIESAARSLGVDNVIVTLGRRGAVVVGDHVVHVPAPKIEAVDTTAAGDAFRSAIAVQVAAGTDLVTAARMAVRVGAATALRFGAQPSLPTPAEVDRLLT
ncbi:MAG: ribokinase [Verrucomicrobiales bacterium]|jgi:ribokinase